MKIVKLLFQGDSITDAGRDRNEPRDLGNGYVSILSASLIRQGFSHELRNTAVGGNRIVDIYARWEEDTLQHDFDILTMLCGINDVGFGLRRNCGISPEKYYFVYDRMLYEVKEKRQNASLVLMEPFLFRVNLEDIKMNDLNDIYEQYDLWKNCLCELSKAIQELAVKYHAIFIPLLEHFENLTKNSYPEEYSKDGVHPTLKGHRVIAERWMKSCIHLLK